MAFRVGQKVVCVKPNPWRSKGERNPPEHYGIDPPQHREIYTVAEIVDDPDLTYLALVELGKGGLWAARFFRPITDISIFTKMLTPKRDTVDAD